MGIDISREFEDEIARRMQGGHYRSVEEFLRESLGRADEYRGQLRAAIAEGRGQADRGELVDGEAVFDRIDAELAEAEARGREG